MKKLTNFWITLLVLTVFSGFTSCSKDDDEEETAKDPTSILTSTIWVVAENGITPQGGDPASKLLVTLAATLEPRQFEFMANNVFNYILLGFPATGTWNLSADFKTLLIKKSDGEQISTYQIVEATTSVVKLKRSYTKDELGSTSDAGILITLKPKM